ncbi:MAG: Gfo/Idh/MocA family oxidoreductase [Lachnospiraceae bacterium]|nr:Gfo/Idh/MocA family oxidoreductase [Lachnospiraceae bacterium]
MHYEWTIEALKHKKPVLCEKPLAPSQQQAAEMFAAAKENGVCLMEAFAYLQSPYVKAVAEEIQKGSIGGVRYMHVHFLTSDYDRSNIRMRRETLGGSMYDIGVYASSLILRLLGESPEQIQAVAAFDDHDIDKLTTVMLEYPDAVRAVLTTGMVMATEKNKSSDSFEIQGTEGTLRSDNFTFNGKGELSYHVERFDGTSEYKTVAVPNNYMLEIEQFGRCVAEGEPPVVTETISIANARLVDSVLECIGY